MKDFASVYKEFQPKVYRYLGNLCGEVDAHDLTQIVFLKVSRSLEGFRGESSLDTWIYRIATNVAHDHSVSSLAKQREAELPMNDTGSLNDFPDSDRASADREFVRREMSACLRGVVDQLPENYRAVLILSDFEELTNPEIAEVLGLSVDTVKIRLHRTRIHLREALESECSLYRDERNELMCDHRSEE